MTTVDLSLSGRAAAFHAALASVQVTDANGRPLDAEAALRQMLDLLRDVRGRKGCLYIAGNGGSAAVASHCVVDFLKVGGLRAVSLTDPSLLTAMSNDISYADAFAEIVSVYTQPGDVVMAISSSGKSANIINAARRVRALGGTAITLSGFAPDNPLRAAGDMNVWLDSRDYGFVEAAHQFVLHNLIDRLGALGLPDTQR